MSRTSLSVPLYKPRLEDVKMNSKEISLISIFAALYAIGVVFLVPFSFLPVQVRIADSLLPLSIIFGIPAIIGLSLGTIVANMYGGLGFIDIIGGTFANLIATFVAWKLCKNNRFPFIVGIGCQIIIISIIVGVYIAYLFNLPIIVGITDIFIGSFLAVGILGSLLLTIIKHRIQSS